MTRYRVFISHGGGDTYLARELLKPKLEASGASVFLDAGSVSYGDDFRRIILDELLNCHELLVLLTPTSIRRPWVMAEIGVAIRGGQRIVPLRYGPSDGDLSDLGILSLLGTASILALDDFDGYVDQVAQRAKGLGHA